MHFRHLGSSGLMVSRTTAADTRSNASFITRVGPVNSGCST